MKLIALLLIFASTPIGKKIVIRNMDEWFAQGWASGRKCEPDQKAIIGGYGHNVCKKDGIWGCDKGYELKRGEPGQNGDPLPLMHC